MKNAVLKKKSIAGVEFQIANFNVFRIEGTAPHLERLRTQVGFASQHCHAGVRLMKICQAVTYLDADARQSFMPEIARDTNVAMPASPKGRNLRSGGPFVNQRRRVQVNVRTEQLNHERHRRRIRYQREQSLFFEQARPQVEMIVFRPAGNFGFV